MIFAGVAFLGAWLLFTLEPMIARMILPALGGTPMVWSTCVMFFQAVLVMGYAAAHRGFGTLGHRRYTLMYLGILLSALVVLPPTVPTRFFQSLQSPVVSLLLALTVSVGVPFLGLAATAPTVQRWFVHAHPTRDPYFLYAASNLGSLAGLAAYPFLIEPMLGLQSQARLWAIGFVAFIIMAAVCARSTWRVTDAPSTSAMPAVGKAGSIRWSDIGHWVTLAFLPSSLMLAVTTYLSTDIAAIPLLWVAPLGIYLITFVIAFGPRARTWRSIADDRLPVVIVGLAVFISLAIGGPLWLVLALHLLGLFLVGLLCHGELAKRRPPPRDLTAFFLWIAFGGMLGGVFNTLLAPVMFTRVAEYPLVLVLACLFRTGKEGRSPSSAFQLRSAIVPLAVAASTAGLIALATHRGLGITSAMYVPALLCFSQRARPWIFAASTGAMLFVASTMAMPNAYGRLLHAERTFFGVYRVSIDERAEYRSLFHGTTLHGVQAVDPARRAEPLSYYHRTGPFGQLFVAEQLPENAEIAVVGLGVGSLASYATGRQKWTFYEIDPAVERIARNTEYFSYLRDCGARCSVIIGDARLSLARARARQYRLIVLDAFSSDAIPIHLLTREALVLYVSRLAPGGILAFHISNRHFVLGPVLRRLAESVGLTAWEQRDDVRADVAPNGKTRSDWLMMARGSNDLPGVAGDPRWKMPPVTARTPLWTDDFANVLAAFNFR